jgi:hypothetical protein
MVSISIGRMNYFFYTFYVVGRKCYFQMPRSKNLLVMQSIFFLLHYKVNALAYYTITIHYSASLSISISPSTLS